jgi:hypothetical protein
MKKKLPINPKAFETEAPRAEYPREPQKPEKEKIIKIDRRSVLDFL